MSRYRFTFADKQPAEREAHVHGGYLVFPDRFNLPYIDNAKLATQPCGEALKATYDSCHKAVLNCERYQREVKRQQNALLKNGSPNPAAAMEYMQKNDALDAALKQSTKAVTDLIQQTLWDNPAFREFFIDTAHAELVVPYDEASRWPVHAHYAASHNISTANFRLLSDALEQLAQRRASGEPDSLIPPLGIIDGAEFGLPDSYMRLLDKDDPRLMWIGKLINDSVPSSIYCCDALNEVSSAQNLAQVSSPNLATLVLQRKTGDTIQPDKDPIIGKTTAWLGTYEDQTDQPKVGICLNGWYGIHRSSVPLMMKEAASRWLTQSPVIHKFTLASKVDALSNFPSIQRSCDRLTPYPQDVEAITNDYNSQGLILSQRMLRASESGTHTQRGPHADTTGSLDTRASASPQHDRALR